MFDRFLPCTRVVALCLDGVVAFDLDRAGAGLRLREPRRRAALRVLDLLGRRGPVATTTGFELSPQGGLELLRAETIVVPGYFAILDPPPAAATAALARAAGRGARVLSVCTGAFALAHAGLLDGRRATTHWGWAGELAARFPAVEVDPAALYVDEGEVMTSAGLSAGIDLSLHVVRKDFGAAAGERVARHMVAAPHRDGGQAQFIKRAARRRGGRLARSRPGAGRSSAWRSPSTSPRWPATPAVSPRTFARRFREETGTTPLQWLLAQRVLEARRLLEETDLPVEDGRLARRLRHRRLAARPLPPRHRDHARPPTGARSGPRH